MIGFEGFIHSEFEKRRRRTLVLTPEQRIERFIALQVAAENTLAANPVALAAFHRRNRQQRTESRVRRLEEMLMHAASRETVE